MKLVSEVKLLNKRVVTDDLLDLPHIFEQIMDIQLLLELLHATLDGLI